MTRPLLSADGFGARWSYDRTISVRNGQTGYVIQDLVRRVTYTRQSLDLARRLAQQILEDRPQIDWLRSWKRHGPPGASGTNWQRTSTDGGTAVWIERLPDGWWSVEVDVNRDVEGGMRSHSWRVAGHHPIGVVQAQATAWAAHQAFRGVSP